MHLAAESGAVAGEPRRPPAPLSASRFERRVMGSALRVTVVVGGSDGPDNVASPQRMWETVSAEFDAADRELSSYRDDSGINQLNRRAGIPATGPVGRRLYDSLAMADRAWRVTRGVFDPRVLVDLERLGHPGWRVPAPAATLASHPRSERWLSRDPRSRAVAIASPLDLGGIGKGLAVRWALQRARAAAGSAYGGSLGVMVDAGGDVAVAGTSPDGGPWLIGIEDPRDGSSPLAVVGVVDGAVCTSSIRLARWIAPDGRPAHHLIDPFTGEPGGEGLVAVTVAGADAAWAEVWSKTLFLAGRAAIAALARERGLAAWWIDDAGEVSMTPAARIQTVWAP